MAKTNISATIDSDVLADAVCLSKTESRNFSNYVEIALKEANTKRQRKRKASAKPVYSTKK